ncbi:MAG TPA: hypothetical protein VFB73_11640 [Chloroflexota bacterium]|nr:hypothetical protein [Chloroflexota bacterium]HZU06616.1 hypothetical protein [Chloroflexota bacterium]
MPPEQRYGAADAAGDESARAAARAALEQRCAERLLEDEALRADLTDDEFQPLRDWALEQLHQCVAALADPAAPEAEATMASVLDGLRAVLRAANDALGRRTDLAPAAFTDQLRVLCAALQPPLYPGEAQAATARRQVEAVLPSLAARKDEAAGEELVRALVAALRAGTAPPADATSGPGEG